MLSLLFIILFSTVGAIGSVSAIAALVFLTIVPATYDITTFAIVAAVNKAV